MGGVTARPRGKKITRTPRRWMNGTYVVGGSVCGTVDKDAFDRGWWAYGCMSDWQDTKLGLHERESTARHAVEQWVKDNE
jgi:hypothetical protein